MIPNFLRCLLFFLPLFLFAEPPREIPEELREEFTLDHTIPVVYWYHNQLYSEPKFFSKKLIYYFLSKVYLRENGNYPGTDPYLFQALDELTHAIKDKEVGIIGSEFPWYEAMILSYGGWPVVIEYLPIKTNFSRITYLTPSEYEKNPRKFDLLLSISSTEHDGLGRYGDPINPCGDLRSMNEFKKMLNPNGLLLLAVPVGQDTLVWNAHRIYGPKRLPMLLKGWEVVKTYGFSPDQFQLKHNSCVQPVFLLRSN